MGKPPSYSGSGLVNLMAEIEARMGGDPLSPRLDDSSAIPDARSYVLVLFDGLGSAQLEHGEAGLFRSTLAGSLQAPFPTTTPVSLATIASALPPSQHAQVAHLMWFPDLEKVVNTLKWVTSSGEPVPYDYATVLPRPNLWERLRAMEVEPITVQPGDFEGSPLSRVVYRGARFERAWDAADLARASTDLAAEPGRFIFIYVPFVDFAGHVYGLASDEFTEAMKLASSIWDSIISALPPGAAAVATADHGLVDVAESAKTLVRDPVFDSLRFAGDPRGVQVWGDDGVIDDLVDLTGGELADPLDLVGPDPGDLTRSRIAPRLLLAPSGGAIIPRGFDKRLRSYHGGLSPEEVDIPLLVG